MKADFDPNGRAVKSGMRFLWKSFEGPRVSCLKGEDERAKEKCRFVRW